MLRFVGAIDEEGNKTSTATAAFNQHDAGAFQKAFGEMVKTSYTELFNLHGDTAWELPFDTLISFFRNTDQTSDVVGRRQASTFQALAGLAGHGEAPAQPKPKQAKEPKAKTTKSNQGKAEPCASGCHACRGRHTARRGPDRSYRSKSAASGRPRNIRPDFPQH